MTVEQLRAFVQSSAKLGLGDKKVADYLKQVKLTNKLDDSTIEDMQGLGAGPKTVDALKELRESSKDLAAPPPPAPKPVAKPIPPPDSKEQAAVLKDVTEYALLYAKNLPNFICTQVTRRYVDPTGMEFWHLQDTVLAELSYFEQKEDYKVVMVNNSAVNVNHQRPGRRDVNRRVRLDDEGDFPPRRRRALSGTTGRRYAGSGCTFIRTELTRPVRSGALFTRRRSALFRHTTG